MIKNNIKNLKKNIDEGKNTLNELKILINQYKNVNTSEEKKMISSQINLLKALLRKKTQQVSENIEKTSVAKPLTSSTTKKSAKKIVNNGINIRTGFQNIPKPKSKKEIRLLKLLEKRTLKRLKKKEKKKVIRRNIKANVYVQAANKLFARKTNALVKQTNFKSLERSIVRSKLPFIPASYLSVIFFTILVSIFAGFFLFLFFLFFNFGVTWPFITKTTSSLASRFFKVIWILIGLPIFTFFIVYFYPSMEEKVARIRIDSELPFATIHMSSIAGSMLDPSNIFEIIISTKEYPFLEKEFNRLMNEINIYGYDLVTALKNIAYNSPSKKLSGLFTGLATTISSGGDLPEFFDKRAETLLLDYKLLREKASKAAETMMDIYISVVIAAPMIFMLLLMMMSISGLGISLSTSTITLITMFGVILINIIFLSVLSIKQIV